jgi:hypothetical protein
MARAGLLPDAIEARFPYGGNGRRTAAIERAARRYDLALLGSSDGHLVPGQLGAQATLYPGESADDLLNAIRQRKTRAVALPRSIRLPMSVHLLQTAAAWLLPFRGLPGVEPARAAIVRRARAAAQRGERRSDPSPPAPLPVRWKRGA